MDADVNALVDGRRKEEAAVVAVVGRQVGAAAAEADAQGAAGDDHCERSPTSNYTTSPRASEG